MEEWKKDDQTVFIHKQHNDVFTMYDLDNFDHDFADYFSLVVSGQDRAEIKGMNSKKNSENLQGQEKQKEEQIHSMILTWLELGKNIVPDDRYEEWEKLVNKSADNPFNVIAIQQSVSILCYLKDGNINRALEEFDSLWLTGSGNSDDAIRYIVGKFAKLGAEEFFKKTDPKLVEERRSIMRNQTEAKNLRQKAKILTDELTASRAAYGHDVTEIDSILDPDPNDNK